MVNRQQFFGALAHRALSGKQIFRGRFVGDEGISGDIPRWIDSLSSSVDAADQAAAFARSGIACMRNDLVELRTLEGNDHVWRKDGLAIGFVERPVPFAQLGAKC